MKKNMKHFSLFCIFFIFHSISFAQTITFSEHIAPIIYKNCNPCHQKGGGGPFPLENYEDVRKNAKLISYVVENKIMPPWKADGNYRSFMHERCLKDSEIQEITNWIILNCPQGPKLKTKYLIPPKNDLGKPDITIKIHEVFNIPAINSDVFVTYVEDLVLQEDRYLRAIEILPGNRKLVHHCRVDLDTIDTYSQYAKGKEYINTKDLNDRYNPKLQFVADYVPGISPYQYPSFAGLKIDKKMKVLINLHYSPSPKEETDQTRVNFYFYPKNYTPRQIVQSYLSSETILGNKLYAKANELLYAHMEGNPNIVDLSLIAIQPHMHLLGKEFLLRAVSENNTDTIPLIHIKDWDFNWQENYYFKKLVHIPKGWRFVADAVFDNTPNNPRNPFNPPRNINFNGEMQTTNEMFEFYFHALEYLNGDENIPLK